MTAFCGLVARRSGGVGGSRVAGNYDFVILVTLLAFVVGASLAWYLPQAAANRRQQPRAESKRRRS